jgi:hypothetical protein
MVLTDIGILKEPAASSFRLEESSTLKMEAAYSSEILVNTIQTHSKRMES